MSIATKNGSVILKSGSVAENCGCCGGQCGAAYPYSDPKDEGTWVPSGQWPQYAVDYKNNLTWTYVPNPGDGSGNTWYFWGSSGTSANGINATFEQQIDWSNPCNWWSTVPFYWFYRSGPSPTVPTRAVRLPDAGSVVHVLSSVDTSSAGPVTVKSIYFWGTSLINLKGGVVDPNQLAPITALQSAYGTSFGSVFFSSVNRRAINGGALFVANGSENGFDSVVNGGAEFYNSVNLGVVNGGALFRGGSGNYEIVNGGATFIDSGNHDKVYGGASFSGQSANLNAMGGSQGGEVHGGAQFQDSSFNFGKVYGGSVFLNSSYNGTGGELFDGAEFKDSASNRNGSIKSGDVVFRNSSYTYGGAFAGAATFRNSTKYRSGFAMEPTVVSGSATFLDDACSEHVVNMNNTWWAPENAFAVIGTNGRKLPTCSGNAVGWAARPSTNYVCGCGQ